MIKKSAILLIIALILFPAMMSCQTISDSFDDTTAEGDGTVANSAEPLKIASAGEPIYKFIRYDFANDGEVDVAKYILSTMNQRFGVSFSMMTDFYAPGTMSTNSLEIIVGHSSRKECLEVLKRNSIGYGDYAIEVIPESKNIIIAALEPVSMRTAVDQFFDGIECTTAEDGKVELIYSGGNKIYRANENTLFSGNADLSDFTIINSSSLTESAALELADEIKSSYGIELQVLSPDEKEPGGHEIIIGSTSNPQRNVIDLEKTLPYQLTFATSDNRLMIGGSSPFTTNMAVEFFIENYLVGPTYYSLNLPSNQKISLNSCIEGDDPALADGADTRVMSFNILSEEWASDAGFSNRDFRIFGTIMKYQPDVAAVQEVSAMLHIKIKEAIGDKYETVRKNLPDAGSSIYTTLIYNKDTTRLIEEGYKVYTLHSDPRLRSICWGLFERIESGERYIVCNTHWEVAAGYESYRLAAAVELADFANELSVKYNAPVICCGDFNSTEYSNAFKKLIETSGFLEAKYSAEVVNRACTTYHKLKVPVDTNRISSIDHIVYSPSGMDVKYYNTLVFDYVLRASDHCPIYIDFDLTN